MAEILGTNKNYVGDLLTVGYIKNIRVGRNYKVMRIWFEDFLNNPEVLPSHAELQIKAKKIRKAAMEVA